MPMFKYIGLAPARPDGTLEFRVPSAKFFITFKKENTFEVPESAGAFVLACIRNHIDGISKQKDYKEIL